MQQFNLYLITNLAKTPHAYYVGLTTRRIAERWSKHQSEARHTRSQYRLYRAMRKYGIENFTIEPLTLLDEDFTDYASLKFAERKMIRLLRVNCEVMNLTDGGEGTVGYKRTGEDLHQLRLHTAKISGAQALEIVELHNQGWSISGLAQKFNVIPRTVRNLCNGKTWGWVTGVRRMWVPRPAYKLSSAQVLEIIALSQDQNWSQARVARKFKVNQSHISRIWQLAHCYHKTAGQAGRRRSRKTHCKYGHERSPETVNQRGQCIICKIIYQQYSNTER